MFEILLTQKKIIESDIDEAACPAHTDDGISEKNLLIILRRKIMATATASGGITKEERKVIFASSLGTVFEWYDFYLYGTLAPIIATQFFVGDPTPKFIF